MLLSLLHPKSNEEAPVDLERITKKLNLMLSKILALVAVVVGPVEEENSSAAESTQTNLRFVEVSRE